MATRSNRVVSTVDSFREGAADIGFAFIDPPELRLQVVLDSFLGIPVKVIAELVFVNAQGVDRRSGNDRILHRPVVNE